MAPYCNSRSFHQHITMDNARRSSSASLQPPAFISSFTTLPLISKCVFFPAVTTLRHARLRSRVHTSLSMRIAPTPSPPSKHERERQDRDIMKDINDMHVRGVDPETSSLPAGLNLVQQAHRSVRARNILAARQLFAEHVRLNPEDTRVWVQWARAESDLASENSARAVLKRAVHAMPSDASVWHFWGTLERRTGNLHAAKELYEKALCQVRSEDASPLAAGAAAVAAALGEKIHARSLFQRAVESDAFDAKSYVQWATFEMREGNAELARHVYERAVKAVRKKDAAVLYTHFAKFEVKWGNVDRARFLYMRAAEADPRDRLTWQAWGVLESTQGKFARARELFERAIVVDPAFASTWTAWGRLEERCANYDVARTLYQRGARADAADSAVWHAWAKLEAHCGNYVESKRLFAHALQCVTSERRAAPLYLGLAKLEVEQGQRERARELYREAAVRNGESKEDVAKILHAHARLERENGNFEAARELYQKALAQVPHDAVALLSLAQLEEHVGRFDIARDLLRRGSEVAPCDARIALTRATLEWTRFAEQDGISIARCIFEGSARIHRGHKSFLRAWAAFERAQGDSDLANRLSALAMGARR